MKEETHVRHRKPEYKMSEEDFEQPYYENHMN